MTARAPAPTASPRRGGRAGYFASARAPRYSVLFALPLLLIYEGLALALSDRHGSGLRNGADVMLTSLAAAVGGRNGPMVLMGAIILLGAWLVWRDRRRAGGRLEPRIFALMFAESVVLALAFGIVIGTVTAQLLGAMHLLAIQGGGGAGGAGTLERAAWPVRLMLSMGAGLYEELFFRVLLVGALGAGARTILGFGRRGAGILAVTVGALVFSAFHYIGPYGDAFTLTSFTFRTISGLAFSAMYVLRGFGITAWTHALYDAFLLLL